MDFQSIVVDFAHSIPHYAVEFRMQHKDGSWKWILARGMVIRRVDAGQPVRMIGSHTDITERKLADAERDRLLKINLSSG